MRVRGWRAVEFPASGSDCGRPWADPLRGKLNCVFIQWVLRTETAGAPARRNLWFCSVSHGTLVAQSSRTLPLLVLSKAIRYVSAIPLFGQGSDCRVILAPRSQHESTMHGEEAMDRSAQGEPPVRRS